MPSNEETVDTEPVAGAKDEEKTSQTRMRSHSQFTANTKAGLPQKFLEMPPAGKKVLFAQERSSNTSLVPSS